MSLPCPRAATIPDELIFEILSRVPVKHLMRFRCVSKSWNSLIFDPTFVKLHLQRSPRDNPILYTLTEHAKDEHSKQHSLHCTSTHRLLQDPSSAVNVDNDGVPLGNLRYGIIGICNGLACLRTLSGDYNETWVRFWNPATRLRSKKSPRIKTLFGYVKMGFGYDDSSNTYKVVAVMIGDVKSHKRLDMKVHTMGDNCWREVSREGDFDFPSDVLQAKGELLNGTVNWAAILGTSKSYAVLSFDIRKETYTCFPLPGDVGDGPSELGVFGGCLCLSHVYDRAHFALWQMKEYGVQESWTLLMKISYEHFQFRRFRFPHPLCLSAKGDVLVLLNNAEFQLIRCTRRGDNNQVDQVEHIKNPRKCVSLDSIDYVQSLVLPYRN